MANINRFILAGNLVNDPELKYTPGGTAICTATLAYNDKWKDKKTGEQKNESSFFDLKIFGESAERFQKWYSKGDNLLIEGKLKQESWTDKTTQQKRSKFVVMVESSNSLSRAKGESDSSPRSQASKPQSRPPAPQKPLPNPIAQDGSVGGVDDDNQIPF